MHNNSSNNVVVGTSHSYGSKPLILKPDPDADLRTGGVDPPVSVVGVYKGYSIQRRKEVARELEDFCIYMSRCQSGFTVAGDI